MEKTDIYEAVRNVPETARRKITGGRLNGKTDINPMWRIKTLTEQFGPCGIGWWVEILDQWLTPGMNNEVAAHVKIALRIKADSGDWSQPIVGIGGSMFVANERGGAYTSDECFKMAYTDAISVACKMLGVGADVYWEADRTKYGDRTTGSRGAAPGAPSAKKRLTMAILDDADKCDKFLNWMYGHWVNAGYAETFDAAATLLKIYDADTATVARFVELFASYKQARNGK